MIKPTIPPISKPPTLARTSRGSCGIRFVAGNGLFNNLNFAGQTEVIDSGAPVGYLIYRHSG